MLIFRTNIISIEFCRMPKNDMRSIKRWRYDTITIIFIVIPHTALEARTNPTVIEFDFGISDFCECLAFLSLNFNLYVNLIKKWVEILKFI